MKTKKFPMQDGPDIDWDTAKEVYKYYAK